MTGIQRRFGICVAICHFAFALFRFGKVAKLCGAGEGSRNDEEGFASKSVGWSKPPIEYFGESSLPPPGRHLILARRVSKGSGR